MCTFGQNLRMFATHQKVVSVSYRLSVNEDGQEIEIENVGSDQPMVFLFGMSGLPPKFEAHLEGQQQGHKFNFMLEPVDGFGERLDDAISEIPMDVFLDENGELNEEEIYEGNIIQLVDDEGYHHRGRILEVGDQTVVMDFNHPLAGIAVRFEGEILHVREADATELAHGHVHGEGGHHH